MAINKKTNGGAASDAAEAARPQGIVPPPDRSHSDRLIKTRSLEQERRPRNAFIAFFTSRRFVFLCIAALAIYLIMAIPHWFWEVAPELPLQITVVDKTVPFSDYREHRALYWLFLQNKFVKPGVEGPDRFYDFRKDYIGALPKNQRGDERETTFVTDEALKNTDVLYFADTYGVYKADYVQFDEPDIAHTEHSPKFFGGLTAEEVAATESYAKRGGTIIGEFSTFASPTPPDLRDRMESLMGVKWTHWIGRYFTDFQDEKDVPKWLYDLYQKQNGKTWDITGSGYMLCRNEEQDFIILTDDLLGNGEGDVLKEGLIFEPSPSYRSHDVMAGVEPAKFTYWFDVMIPLKGTDVLATYQWNLTESGRKKLAAKGLSLEFPAVLRREGNYTSYYFAGEYAHFFRSMGEPDTRMTMYINRSFYGRPIIGSTEFFYWGTSYPLTSNILRRECNRINKGIPENVYLFDDEQNVFKRFFSQ